MHRLSRVLLVLWVAASPLRGIAAEPGQAPDLPPYSVADPKLPPVTMKNLFANDRFWPYRVKLVRDWKPPGQAKPLRARSLGVLIRVEPSGLARVDFGRDGLYSVPVSETDLLAEANRVRTGALTKVAPNFALAIGPRLLGPGETRPGRSDFAQAAQKRGFLAVFADPFADGFEALSKALAPLPVPEGVATILFPMSRQTDAQVAERLRSVGWTEPFVMGNLSEAYAESLLPEGTSQPAVLLQTNEGRLLYQSGWSPQAMPALTAALEKAFSGSSR